MTSAVRLVAASIMPFVATFIVALGAATAQSPLTTARVSRDTTGYVSVDGSRIYDGRFKEARFARIFVGFARR